MILLPPNVKVHLALGYVDMRKGLDGLAMLVQGMLRQDRSRAICSCSGAAPEPTSSRSCSGTGPDCVSSQAARAWRLPVAAERRCGGDAVAQFGAAVTTDRWCRLARAGTTMASVSGGVMVRLIDSTNMLFGKTTRESV